MDNRPKYKVQKYKISRIETISTGRINMDKVGSSEMVNFTLSAPAQHTMCSDVSFANSLKC